MPAFKRQMEEDDHPKKSEHNTHRGNKEWA